MKDLQIVSLTRKMLKDALEQNLYWQSDAEFVPFSKNKALWLLKNERIEDEDVCAILGIENNTLVSFIYLIPDLINTDQGTAKIYWSSRWWVAEKHKESILSAYTKRVSLEATKNQLIIKYLGTDTLDYYKKHPYKEFSKRTRYIFVFNLDHHLFINKFRFLKAITPLIKGVSNLSHYLIASINKNKIKTGSLSCEYISDINKNTWLFIEKHVVNDLIPKSKDYINWQIDNNQYTLKNKKLSYNCLIGSISHKIHNTNFFVKMGNKIIGFISVLVRGDEFVTRYFLCDHDHYQYCLDALMEYFIESKCTFLLTEDEVLGAHISKKFLKAFTNKRALVSLVHNDISLDFSDKKVYQQDGHFA
ncbi:hypothetical protein Q4Q35_15155 [Flavivirga aquimarina]|uniref:GNAT family N-acetyltransferase n=1 Tax=Flavivirga aquimarina TaxID=2027862 RepID=A0ABT8WDD9_9FLAO|nr:hypothetical protein [Flavivirga aquimarina]MDO5971145.1 hypothetical protein [Flavivirga aquimarina]